MAAVSAAAVRSASSASTSWRRRISAPSATASAVAARVAGPRSLAGNRLLPRPRADGTQEVLAGEGDEQRPTELAQLAEAPQHLEVVVDREVEVEAGVESDPLGRDPELARPRDPGAEPLEQVGHDVVVGGRRAVHPGRALDVHEHVAATALRDHLEHLRLAAADVVDRRGAGVDRGCRDPW